MAAPVDLDQLVRRWRQETMLPVGMGMSAHTQLLHRTEREAAVMRSGWRGAFVMGLEVVALGMGIAMPVMAIIAA